MEELKWRSVPKGTKIFEVRVLPSPVRARRNTGPSFVPLAKDGAPSETAPSETVMIRIEDMPIKVETLRIPLRDMSWASENHSRDLVDESSFATTARMDVEAKAAYLGATEVLFDRGLTVTHSGPEVISEVEIFPGICIRSWRWMMRSNTVGIGFNCLPGGSFSGIIWEHERAQEFLSGRV